MTDVIRWTTAVPTEPGRYKVYLPYERKTFQADVTEGDDGLEAHARTVSGPRKLEPFEDYAWTEPFTDDWHCSNPVPDALIQAVRSGTRKTPEQEAERKKEAASKLRRLKELKGEQGGLFG